MSRKLDDILAALPEGQRQRIETRAAELRQEIEAQWKALGIDPNEWREPERQFIPVQESIAEWRKAPEYVKAYEALEDEFSAAAAIRETASDLHRLGFIDDDEKRKFDRHPLDEDNGS